MDGENVRKKNKKKWKTLASEGGLVRRNERAHTMQETGKCIYFFVRTNAINCFRVVYIFLLLNVHFDPKCIY